MNEEQVKQKNKGIIITAVIVGGLAVLFYTLFIVLRM